MIEIMPIAIAHTPFKQKFGIPRQSGLISVSGEIELLPPFNQPEAVKGIRACSHLWLIFQFSANPASDRLSVRPPRLGGNDKLGVFATRASFRPNGLGMSLVALDAIEFNEGVKLKVSGVDLLDQTPIIDIKPYLPYADMPQGAVFNAIAPEAPAPSLLVRWADQACADVKAFITYSEYTEQELMTWITAIVEQDPRPAYKSLQDEKSMRLHLIGLMFILVSLISRRR
ncbi:MAG: tRNA (N6-threonylcarbamoyladenosine(37)-N6)-methyltransferase TrmO [Cellvibrionales bacterium]|nr:tRNA (N6-threonylcarbamoyladenosine(37)-N6)-methyltransferase TrmO [Cellvibrionales bacterium]